MNSPVIPSFIHWCWQLLSGLFSAYWYSFYRAKHVIAIVANVVCLSVRLSVTLVDCNHVHWDSRKVISRINTVIIPLLVDLNIIIGLVTVDHVETTLILLLNDLLKHPITWICCLRCARCSLHSTAFLFAFTRNSRRVQYRLITRTGLTGHRRLF